MGWVRIKIPELSGQERCLLIPQKDFDEKISGVQRTGNNLVAKMNLNPVMISDLASYLKCVAFMRVVSLAAHVISLLTYETIRNSQNDDAAKYIEQLKDAISAENNKIANIGTYNDKNSTIITIVEGCLEKKSISETTRLEIKRSRRAYEAGGMFGYYRGVGRTIYPDEPGIFRGERLREEDRWYRELKTQFQTELEKKPYLDRLSMMQHYELPTRMLDVTSSPLVALYMTSNTIYTGDQAQTGTGEIIVYYDGEVPNDFDGESAGYICGNYRNDIAYVHDGKAYDSSVVLVLAALTKLKYENKERLKKVLKTFGYLIKNICKENPQIDEVVLLELVNVCFHTCGACYESPCYFTSNEMYRIKEHYGTIIGDRAFKRADQICNILWELAHNTVTDTTMPSQVYNNLDEFCDEYLKVIPSYKYILSTVRRENSAFVDNINVFDMLKCFHVKIGRTNDRIQAQSGSFIMCGLEPSYIREHMLSSRTPGMVRFYITNKKEIMKELNAIGINDKTMLPDMAHHTKYLVEHV